MNDVKGGKIERGEHDWNVAKKKHSVLFKFPHTFLVYSQGLATYSDCGRGDSFTAILDAPLNTGFGS